jgi:hypothetical protein
MTSAALLPGTSLAPGVALIATLIASLIGLVRTIRKDGLGHRQPPRSRVDWSAGPDDRMRP